MRNRSVTVAVLVMLAFGVVLAPDGPARTPAAISSDLAEALDTAGVNRDRMPRRLLELDGFVLCGADVISQVTPPETSGARCFRDQHLAELDAVYVVTRPTVEGDPITIVYVTGALGKVTAFIDSTRDHFGTQVWTRWDGEWASAAELTPGAIPLDGVETSLADPTPAQVEEASPSWFLDREFLPPCGVEARTTDRDLDARECFHGAVAPGGPAEYVVVGTGDEGDRQISWFRVLGPGKFEVMTRSLPSASSADRTLPTWRRLRCATIGFHAEPGSEVFMVPFADDASGCVPA